MHDAIQKMVSTVIGSELSQLRFPDAWEKISLPSLPTTQKTVPGISVCEFAVAASMVLLRSVIVAVERDISKRCYKTAREIGGEVGSEIRVRLHLKIVEIPRFYKASVLRGAR